VPPCIVCHGAHAQGVGPFPRLADQHRAYLEGQLQAFKINSRANSMMHANALNMTDAQMRAVAAYLASR
jgi:cytochrome c553